MRNKEQLLKYLKEGVNALLEQECFDGGQEFRTTQREALDAYRKYLNKRGLSTAKKLKGFFEIPTGVGKTAVFTGIVAAAHWVAENNNDELKTVIVVPTTQLLTQTKEAFLGNEEEGKEGFAPWLDGYIGLYGDGHKNLKSPITIMTYNAWFDRSQDGTIGSHNVDILISDEAHRGTSERRIENVKDNFDETTSQIAFTATAHFDEKKSVQASHEREIFYKSVRDAVLEGELAAYIQSQRLIIRVEPDEHMLSKEFKQASTFKKANYRRHLRQNVWNQYALKAFKKGIDERTGDLLSDNKAGFFVEGTRQADDLADMLNGDTELTKKAKKLGCVGVAISIHTQGMSKKEQERRFKAYLSGKYMAVVGDEKFKEGFDYPPIKTVIDSQHASVVDKAQILGRGARKFWNKRKKRYEGLTVVDTVIYIGSDDPEEDNKLREGALRKAVSVKDVLEETYALSPVAPTYDLYFINKNGSLPNEFEDTRAIYIHRLSQNSFNIRTFNHMGDMEDFTSEQLSQDWIKKIQEVYKSPTLLEKNSEQQQFIEELRINLGQLASPDKRKRLKNQVFGDDPNSEYLVDLQHLYHLEKELSKLRKEHWVDVSTEDIAYFVAEEKRTGIGGHALFNRMKARPDELTEKIAEKIIAGVAQSARMQHIEALKQAYSEQPDSGIKSKPIRVSKADSEFFKKKVKDTGIKGVALFASMQNPPAGLTEGKAAGIVSGRTKTGLSEHIKALKDEYKRVSSFTQSSFRTANSDLVPISEDDKKLIQSEQKRTGFGSVALHSTMKALPSGLSKNMIQKIVSGKAKSASPKHMEAIKKAYAQIEDNAKDHVGGGQAFKSGHVAITEEDKAFFREAQERTGISGKGVYAFIKDPPETLNAYLARDIIRGKRKSTHPDNIKILKTTYHSLLSNIKSLSREDIVYFKREKKRTGMSASALFNTMANIPSGLTIDKIDSLLRGRAKKVSVEYYDAVVEALKKVPVNGIK